MAVLYWCQYSHNDVISDATASRDMSCLTLTRSMTLDFDVTLHGLMQDARNSPHLTPRFMTVPSLLGLFQQTDAGGDVGKESMVNWTSAQSL